MMLKFLPPVTMILAAGRRNDLAWLSIGIMVLAVVSVMMIIAAASRREKKRTAELKDTAASLGFEFIPKDNSEYLKSLKTLNSFSRIGRSQKILNLMRGRSSNIEVTIFDHTYVISTGEHSHTRKQSVICFQSEAFSLPDFTLAPKKFWNKIGSMLGRQSIEFNTHPAFSENYLLRGDDIDAIREVFTPPVLEYFEEHLGYNAEGSGNQLLLYKASKRIPPAETTAFLEEGLQALSLLHSG